MQPGQIIVTAPTILPGTRPCRRARPRVGSGTFDSFGTRRWSRVAQNARPKEEVPTLQGRTDRRVGREIPSRAGPTPGRLRRHRAFGSEGSPARLSTGAANTAAAVQPAGTGNAVTPPRLAGNKNRTPGAQRGSI